jgi:hypothetical protein
VTIDYAPTAPVSVNRIEKGEAVDMAIATQQGIASLVKQGRSPEAALSTSQESASAPWLLNRLGLDPAFGSGPLATVIQDLLSVVIYLAIATAMIN